MWQRLRRFKCSPPQNTAGKSQATPIVNEEIVAEEIVNEEIAAEDIKRSPCYVKPKIEHRWQGDIYSWQDFASVPTSHVPYWMLLNRTCHLVEDGATNRTVKLPYLVYCTAVPISTFIEASGSSASLKNQVGNLVNSKNEGNAFLPACPDMGINEPLVVDFNMVYSFQLAHCPKADRKVIQLSSPFAEHLIQRFSRWFYTVGYDDSEIKSAVYIDSLVKSLEK
jgi:hypothetical protein